jgi:hypothetical protein
VGKIDHMHEAKDRGQTHGNQGINAPDDESVDKLLKENNSHFFQNPLRI